MPRFEPMGSTVRDLCWPVRRAGDAGGKRMRDEEYQSDQVPAYGAREQPAVAARMTPHLRMTQVGTGLAVLAVLVTGAALLTFPRFTTASAPGVAWSALLLVCWVLRLGICVVQLVAWRQARAWWGVRREVGPAKL